MKKTYITPAARVQDIFADNIMESDIISDGGGNYHEDVYPDDNPTGKEAQAPATIWDDGYEE